MRRTASVLIFLVSVLALLGRPHAASPERTAEEVSPPRLRLRELRYRAPDGVLRRVRIGVPAAWTGERGADGHALRLSGPNGEGKLLVAAVSHPSELSAYLSELKDAHPEAAPSPPEYFAIEGVSAERGERATRFSISGNEVGEMVMIEKHNTIVLVVSVVAPEVWSTLAPLLARVYRTVQIDDAPSHEGRR